MDDQLYRQFQYSSPADTNFLGDNGLTDHHHNQLVLTHEVVENHEFSAGLTEMSDIIKSQIATHPLYPSLLSAYVECRKVGAPPEMASVLEEISKENHVLSTCNTEIGSDPELDDFMKSYCEILHKYKEELSRPFDEATDFLSSIESQLSDLCKETLPSTTFSCPSADDDGGPYEDVSCGEIELVGGGDCSIGIHRQGDNELKEMLMRKYSGFLSNLRKEFLKKRKKGKLPKGARNALQDWWNTHYRWPYPTEEEKNKLSDMTGLDQKQINNWFINQRKRHWRLSDDMRFALMEGVSGAGNINAESSIYFDANGGIGGIDT